MKILQLTNKVPYPPEEGGSIAINIITQGLLNAGHSVKILAMNTSKHPVDMDIIPLEYKNTTTIESVFVDNRVKPFDALFNLLFTNKSYNITRFISKKFEQKIIEILKKNKFDIVILESLFIAPYIDTIRTYSNARIILRAHNVEHYIWERMANSCSIFFKKYYLTVLSKRLKKFELTHINKVDGIAAISPQDVTFFKQLGCTVPLIDIPVAIAHVPDEYETTNAEFPGFFHIGSMNWMPNIEGLRWLLENIWPIVLSKKPDSKLTLAGRNFPSWFAEQHFRGVNIIGEVPDAAAFMNSKQVMLVPLLSGSGMRVKIIEGMSLGKTIISTTIGAEGINYSHQKNIIIADSAETFANAILQCAEDKKLCETIGRNAILLIQNQYNNSIVTTKLINFFNKISGNEKN